MEESILILSDGAGPHLGSPLVAVGDRDAAAEHLSRGGLRAVCLDRREIQDVLSDARWLRRRRNKLPVLSWVDRRQVALVSELLAAGVEEIIVRDGAAR